MLLHIYAGHTVRRKRQKLHREIEKFIIRQPPMGEKDDYDSENSWISDGLPRSSRSFIRTYEDEFV